MPRRPLTRDQHTARALGLFLGFTTAVTLFFWITRTVEFYSNFNPDYSEMTDEDRRQAWSESRWWNEHRTPQSPCEVYYVLEADVSWLKKTRYEFGHTRTSFASAERSRQAAKYISIATLGIVLLFVFRVVMLIVRLAYPCGDFEEESETEG